MSLVGLELDNGDILLKFVETGAETGGALHVQEARYRPTSSPPPLHSHPSQEERFQIVEGGLEFTVAGDTRVVRAGSEIIVPKGVLHKARNPFEEQALVRWEIRPAQRSAEFFRAMYTATRGRSRPPLHEAAAILREFRSEFRLAKPPALVQTILFGCLAPFGRAALLRT
jgi:quercetin dioxygenase-like cupin family protein